MARKSYHVVEFERRKLQIKPLATRLHDLQLTAILPLKEVFSRHPTIDAVAEQIVKAKRRGAAVILMVGGHVIRSGVQNYIIDLMEDGVLSCIAMNGSGIIHDYEFALIGATTENVACYVKEGQFGLWEETGRINDIINRAHKDKMGLGQAVGKAIWEGAFPHKNISLLAAGFRLRIPITVHVSIGYDIIHEHPNCDGAATGATSYRDFLRFAKIVENLEEGVVMNFGSAVMAPEVFLKALSMARNLARQNGKEIRHFTTLVCDLYKLSDDYNKEADKDSPEYFFRPWKTFLVRTIAGGGQGFYVQARHSYTIPALWSALRDLKASRRSGS
jgi:hypothetical protein